MSRAAAETILQSQWRILYLSNSLLDSKRFAMDKLHVGCEKCMEVRNFRGYFWHFSPPEFGLVLCVSPSLIEILVNLAKSSNFIILHFAIFFSGLGQCDFVRFPLQV